MNTDKEYHIREKFDDEFSRSIAAMAKQVLKENAILESIIQKYTVAYNTTLERRTSARSLQVMNENHKPIFSTISSSGVIKSPRSSSSAEKNAEVPSIIDQKFRKPVKTSRINAGTERKRLSFDISGNDYMNPSHALTEDFLESQTIVTNPEKESTASSVAVVETIRPLDTGSSFFNNKEKSKPEERLNLDENNEDVTAVSTDDQFKAILTIGGDDNYEVMRVASEKSNIKANTVDEEKKSWYLRSSSSFFKSLIEPNSDTFISERFNLNDKPETFTSLDMCVDDESCVSTKTFDNPYVLSTPEKKNGALLKNTVDDQKSPGCLTSPSFFGLEEKTGISEKLHLNEKVCADEKLGTVSTSFKTTDKLHPTSNVTNNQEKTFADQIRVKKVTFNSAPTDPQIVSLTKDVGNSNDPETDKRKSVDYTEMAIQNPSLVPGYQEFQVVPKMSEMDEDITMIGERNPFFSVVSNMHVHDSIYPTGESPMEQNKPFYHAMNGKDYFNRIEYFMYEQDAAQSRKTSDLLNNNEHEVMSVSTTIAKDSASYSTENDQIKASDSKSASYSIDELIQKSSGFADKKQGVELLTNLMVNLSPSVKRSSEDNLQKSITKGSASRKLCCMRDFRSLDNTSETSSPERKGIFLNVQSPKPKGVDPSQAEKFLKTLQERKTCWYMYRHLFVEYRNDLRFIGAYIQKLTAVILKIPTDEHNDLKVTIDVFSAKASKLFNRATAWELDAKEDIKRWDSCLQNIKRLQYDVAHFREELGRNVTLVESQIWEARLKIICKKADDLTLLRDIRRPTILQFGHELERLIQLFTGCIHTIGLFK